LKGSAAVRLFAASIAGMTTIRELFAFPRSGEAHARGEAIKALAAALGYERSGKNIHETLDNDLQTAVRPGILDNVKGELRLLIRSVMEDQRDHLIAILLAAAGQCVWLDRDDLITATARHLGYRRTSEKIREELKSAINGGIRRGKLEGDGSRVRR